MKVLSYNVNGIRAAVKKGLLSWLEAVDADVVCLQEIKSDTVQFPVDGFKALGYYTYLFPAQKSGYSGVAICTKTRGECRYGWGDDRFDKEGRYIRWCDEKVQIVNVYQPSGASSAERQLYKLAWLEAFKPQIEADLDRHERTIICGDMNICHQSRDIHNPNRYREKPGFTEAERKWMDAVLAMGFTDAFRMFSDGGDQYTWWSYMTRARERNVGWRIDYMLTSEAIRQEIKRCIHLYAAKHSDHCPVLLETRV